MKSTKHIFQKFYLEYSKNKKWRIIIIQIKFKLIKWSQEQFWEGNWQYLVWWLWWWVVTCLHREERMCLNILGHVWTKTNVVRPRSAVFLTIKGTLGTSNSAWLMNKRQVTIKAFMLTTTWLIGSGLARNQKTNPINQSTQSHLMIQIRSKLEREVAHYYHLSQTMRTKRWNGYSG